MRRPKAAFSLVEVALAIGIVSFALLAIVALLPIGVKNNQISSNESRAANILTLLESDLRNSHPLGAHGRSQLFQLPLPYLVTNGLPKPDPNLVAGSWQTVNLTESEDLVEFSDPKARYQVSVIYNRVPSNSQSPIQARLVVNWPPLNTANPVDLTDLSKVQGYVDTIMSFSQP